MLAGGSSIGFGKSLLCTRAEVATGRVLLDEESTGAVNPLQQPEGQQHPDQVSEQHLGVAEHRQHFQGGDRQVVGHAAAADGNAGSLH